MRGRQGVRPDSCEYIPHITVMRVCYCYGLLLQMALRLPLHSSSRLASFALFSTVQPSHYSREIYCFFISRQVEVGERVTWRAACVAWPISNHNVSVSRIRGSVLADTKSNHLSLQNSKIAFWLQRAHQMMINRFLIATVWYYILKPS